MYISNNKKGGKRGNLNNFEELIDIYIYIKPLLFFKNKNKSKNFQKIYLSK